MKIPKFVNVTLVIETETGDTNSAIEKSIKSQMTELINNNDSEVHKLVAYDINSISDNIKY